MVYTWYMYGIFQLYAVLQRYVRYIPSKNLMGLFHTMEQTHEVFTRYIYYIPDISLRMAYNWNIPCIYNVYNKNIIYIYIYIVYTTTPKIGEQPFSFYISIYHVYTMYKTYTCIYN
jgi:hypothetical protein